MGTYILTNNAAQAMADEDNRTLEVSRCISDEDVLRQQ